LPEDRKGSPRGALSRINPGLAVASALGIVYLLQAATPLRLDDDAVDYLRMAAAIADGRPVPRVPVPIGYPVFLALLDRAGLASSSFFVVANCLFVALGLFAAWKILSDKTPATQWCAIVFTLLAIPVIKSVPIALPEATFFGVSLLALWTMSAGTKASGSKRLRLLGAAFMLTAIATSVRLVGVTLVPALIWSAALPWSEARDEPRRNSGRIVLFAAAGVLLAGFLIVIARSGPFSVYDAWTRSYYRQGSPLLQIAKHSAAVLKIWGEVALNLPFSRFRDSGGLFTAAGLVLALLALLLTRGSGRLTAARVYMFTYIVVLIIWPRPSPRLWVPIIPLIIGETASAIGRLHKRQWKSALVAAYCAWFIMTGIVALAYSSRITFSSGDFAAVYGRNGGMASPSVSMQDSVSVHRRVYNEEAKKLMARYGGR